MAVAVAVEEHGVGERDEARRNRGCGAVRRPGGVEHRLRVVAKGLETGTADDSKRDGRVGHTLLGRQ